MADAGLLDRVGRVDRLWFATAGLALLGASQWLATPRIEYLALYSVATGIAIALTHRFGRAQRSWALATGLALAISAVGASVTQYRLSADADRWQRYAAEQEAAAVEALQLSVSETLAQLDDDASAALGAPTGEAAAFRQLNGLIGRHEDRAVLLMEDGAPFAWAGRPRVLPDSGMERRGVASSEFYLSLYATASRGNRTALATAVVHALPPADRIAQSLTSRIESAAGLAAFVVTRAVDTAAAPPGSTILDDDDRPLFVARAVMPSQPRAELRILERSRLESAVLIAAALLSFIVAAWRSSRSTGWRFGALALGLGCTAAAPLSAYSNVSRLFDPSLYYTPIGGPLTANAGALGITSTLLLLGLLAAYRRHGRRPRREAAVAVVLLIVGLGPFLLRDLARGIRPPAYGVSGSLWLIWEIPLFLAAVSVLLAGATAGSALLGRGRGLSVAVAPLLAAGAALITPIVWQAPAGWPWWYTLLWVAAIATLALSRQSRAMVGAAALVASLGATTLVWGNVTRGRVDLARRDVAQLQVPDEYARELLVRFAAVLEGEPAPSARHELLRLFVESDLASAGYPVRLGAWRGGARVASFATAEPRGDEGWVADIASLVERRGQPTIRADVDGQLGEMVLAVPGAGGGVTTVAVYSRSQLARIDPFARILGVESDPPGEQPYSLRLASGVGPLEEGVTQRWARRGGELHGDMTVAAPGTPVWAHIEVEMRPLDALIQRGALVVLLNLVVVGALWMLNTLADGGISRWARERRRRWQRSYRARLSLALFAFFVIPAVAFAIWSYRQLVVDSQQARVLLVREALRAVAPQEGIDVSREGQRLGAPVLLYESGLLSGASDPLYQSLAPLGLLLDPAVAVDLREGEDLVASGVEQVAGASVVFGYRAVDEERVLASPARVTEVGLDRRREDLTILVLFATAMGALAALWLSGVAARQLAQPIGALRGAALAIAGGARNPELEGEPTVEFQPVFAAFDRMAADLSASRSALEAAQRRTAAVLRNVASGVVAVGEDGRVTLANPRADVVFEAELAPGTLLADVDRLGVAPLVAEFLRGSADEESFEIDRGDQRYQGRLTRLRERSAVVTLDDVTELARAQRVLAWGEMARQVAHEIKNPLTPIRLGVQHLRRARADSRVDFDRVLEQNVTRILEEIDRLDEIARSFSKYGSAPEDRAPAVPFEVMAVVRDVMELEAMGESGVVWSLTAGEERVMAMGRGEELREVLLNVLENARLAEARNVRVAVGKGGEGYLEIRVADDGHGIPQDVMPRIFEPHFSTRTSGSGLGLAISRRIVTGWGGDIAVESSPERGTEVTLTLREAPSPASA
jgi:two-component system, NtrC family, nitrogen regulation sensor histidine kinase NtrY